MNKELLKRIVVRNALFWMMAMLLPIVVMVVLDLFELHTPARVALFSGLSLIVPFILSILFLSRELGRLIPETRGPERVDEPRKTLA
jgi:hypothetical protein